MELKYNILKILKKIKNNMQPQYSFSNYLNRKFQIKESYGDFQRGEVLNIVEFIGIENSGTGYLVTDKRKRIKEEDAGKYLIPYNSNSPTIPIFETIDENVNRTPDPYKQMFKLDDTTTLTNKPKPLVAQKSQQIINDSNLFTSFENDKIKLHMTLEVNLPKWTFVRDMYKNATDKDKFIAELVSHIHKQISPDIIKSTVVNKLTVRAKKTPLKLKEKSGIENKNINVDDTDTKS